MAWDQGEEHGGHFPSRCSLLTVLTLQTPGSRKSMGGVNGVLVCVRACVWERVHTTVCFSEVCTQTCCVPLTLAGPHPTDHAVESSMAPRVKGFLCAQNC